MFCGGAFYLRFRKLLNKANISANHKQHKPNTAIAIKAAVAIRLEDDGIIAEIFANARRRYINITTMNEEPEEYEDEMRNVVEEKKHEIKKDYQAQKTLPMKFRSH